MRSGSSNTKSSGRQSRAPARFAGHTHTHDLRGVVSERSRDLIDLAWCYHTSLPLYVDLSQSASRKPWTAVIRSMVSNSTYYSFAEDRVLTPGEHLRMLGIVTPTQQLPQSVNIRNLAGEAMAAPCVALAISIAAQLLDVWGPTRTPT